MWAPKARVKVLGYFAVICTFVVFFLVLRSVNSMIYNGAISEFTPPYARTYTGSEIAVPFEADPVITEFEYTPQSKHTIAFMSK